MHTFDPRPSWTPVAGDASKTPLTPKDPDPRDAPIPFSLTQRERDIAIAATLELEIKRRQQNRKDEARALSVLLEGGWEP